MNQEDMQTAIRQGVQEAIASSSNTSHWQNTVLAIIGICSLISGIAYKLTEGQIQAVVAPVQAEVRATQSNQVRIESDLVEIKHIVNDVNEKLTDLRIEAGSKK